ncbi:MAG: TrbI/VirB10 family protein, partial [Acidobacteriaceae bacterium]|nr:TrbI/VirB10 family protein [Acidobacteriaceae bacterium]
NASAPQTAPPAQNQAAPQNQAPSQSQAAPENQPPSGFKQREQPQPADGGFNIAPGTHILLSMINSVSSKQSQVGDRIYLETAFPVLVGTRVVVPQGSWVIGTVTDVKRPARALRRGELQVRFDSLTLPNGVSRNFSSGLGSIDARDPLKHEHDKVTSSDSGKGKAAEVVAATTLTGVGVGSAVGFGTGHAGRGVGIGAGAGAAAGMVAVLLMHGADASLSKGATIEMVLDRTISFQPSELDFSNVPPRTSMSDGGSHAQPQAQRPGFRPGIPW